MAKILIIGQAPPAVAQTVPYDTTLLYEMLSWVGISKQDAQNMFEFEAVSNVFPGFENGRHKKPSLEQMQKHWDDTLETKVQCANKVWLMGNVAREFFYSQTKTWSCNLEILETVHPSKRNNERIMYHKEEIINRLKQFIDA